MMNINLSPETKQKAQYVGRFLFHGNYLTAILLAVTIIVGYSVWSGTRHASSDKLATELASRGVQFTPEQREQWQANRHKERVEWASTLTSSLQSITPLILGLGTIIVGYLKYAHDNRRKEDFQKQKEIENAEPAKNDGPPTTG